MSSVSIASVKYSLCEKLLKQVLEGVIWPLAAMFPSVSRELYVPPSLYAVNIKALGVIFAAHISYNERVSHVCSKVRKFVGALHRNCFVGNAS